MPLPTMNIPDFSGLTHTVNLANSGRQAAADSSAVALSNEDLAALTASRPVTGTFWQATQPVSIATMPSTPVTGTFWQATQPVSGTFWQATQPVSGTVAATQSGTYNITNISGTVSLPTGAATSANQSSVIAGIGAITDTAWTTGSGSQIALLKAIAANAISTADSPVEVHQPCDVISFTPTLDTAIYASGDVLFATAAITGITRANDLRANLQSLTVIDKSKQNPAFTLLFYQTNVTSAAANAANALSDADQITCLGFVNIAAADYLTFANNSVLCYSGAKAPNLILEAATGTTTVYVVGILQAGTPTFAVGDLVLKLGVVQQ